MSSVDGFSSFHPDARGGSVEVPGLGVVRLQLRVDGAFPAPVRWRAYSRSEGAGKPVLLGGRYLLVSLQWP